MRRTLAVCSLSLVLLASCLTTETRQAISSGAARVAAISQKIKETESSPESADRDKLLADLRVQLASARIDYEDAQARGVRERVASAAGGVEASVGVASPIIGLFFPVALPILGIIGALAAGVRERFSRKAA